MGDVRDDAEMMGSRFRVLSSHMGLELFLEDLLLTKLSKLRMLSGQTNLAYPALGSDQPLGGEHRSIHGSQGSAYGEVMTEEMIITKLMVDGEDMVRLEGVLMPMSK